jgi:transposase InsO family protein
VLTHAGVEPVKTQYHAPNANAFAERWIRSAREECLRHLVLFGIRSLRCAVHAYARFFNDKRPHQGIGNRVPCRVGAEHAERAGHADTLGEVGCEESLGGLLKSYRRVAA